ncbi:uncharacterized protein N7518_003779 [Penicillium psychrosexuale]|uniref:uncharacterized protein n=1 Tax=Penicillium psychrosexuale TaxID=1002107 RepID=UPI0025454395|nr:uncharacterized protein N7518_003779 [Penicillium psychrosexuale]KAJ5801711.1 hypothetical protein N7518_003779 [Penicillium psychrosexuale]
MSNIENLPTELILLVVSFLPSESSLAALALSSRRLYGIFNRCLYHYNVLHSNSSALDWAAQNGRMGTLKKALEAGAPLPKKQGKGKMRQQGPMISEFGSVAPRRFMDFRPHPISLAASGGHTDIVRYMIDRGVSPDTMDPERRTLLALAAIHGHASLARYLLQVGADQDIKSFRSDWPVWLAAFQGHVDVVEVLVSAPKQRSDKENLLIDALVAAVLAWRVPVVRLLFIHGVQVNFLSANGNTPLMTAAVREMSDLVSMLLAYGADPNLTADKRQSAPLGIAALHGYEEIVRILVDQTADIQRTKALGFAVLERKTRIVEIILQSGASPQYFPCEIPKLPEEDDNEEWVQPLLYAVKSGHLDLVELLLEYGADVNVPCSEYPDGGFGRLFDRVLFVAVEESDEEMVNLLLEWDANPEITDMVGQPPLTYAINGGNENIVQSLLDHGANPHRAVDHYGSKLTSYRKMKQSMRSLLQDAEEQWPYR